MVFSQLSTLSSTTCRTLPLAWSQVPVVVSTSCQCYGSCTGCQFVSKSRSRSRSLGLYINRSLVLLPHILLMTVIFCLTLVIVRWGLIPATSGRCSWEHTTNLATEVSRQPFLVEQSSTRTVAAGTLPRFFQMIFENTSLWRLKRLVTLFYLQALYK